MKILLLLGTLILGAPVWAQTENAVPPAAPQAVESPQQSWDFTPDFLRGQHQISWRLAPKFEDDLLVSTLTDDGVTVSEVIRFPDADGQTVATLTANFDKKGRLQKQELRGAQSKLLQTQTDFNKSVPISVPGSMLSLQTIVSQGTLKERVLSIGLPNSPLSLRSKYDERGRRTRDDFRKLAGGHNQSVDYLYNARGLETITVSGDNAATLSIERDDKGKMRAVHVLQNGLLARFAAPLRDSKGKVSGTKIESYSGGILSETSETYLEGDEPLDPNRPRGNFTERTITENGEQKTERKFDFSVGIGKPKVAAAARPRILKRTVYASAKLSFEEISRDGVLRQRTDFNSNGVIFKLTQFNADGSVASTLDMTKVPYVDGNIIRRAPDAAP